jgi:hypothetical protein
MVCYPTAWDLLSSLSTLRLLRAGRLGLEVTAVVVTPGAAFCNEGLIQLTIKLLRHIFLGKLNKISNR